MAQWTTVLWTGDTGNYTGGCRVSSGPCAVYSVLSILLQDIPQNCTTLHYMPDNGHWSAISQGQVTRGNRHIKHISLVYHRSSVSSVCHSSLILYIYILSQVIYLLFSIKVNQSTVCYGSPSLHFITAHLYSLWITGHQYIFSISHFNYLPSLLQLTPLFCVTQ